MKIECDLNYRNLKEHGIGLTRNQVDFIEGSIREGIDLLTDHLGLSLAERPTIPIIVTDKFAGVGYLPERKAINLPPQFLHDLKAATSLAPEGTMENVTMHFVHEPETVARPIRDFLRIIGIAETTHYLQNRADPRVKTRFSKVDTETYMKLTRDGKYLSDIEVEERETVDKVLVGKGKLPVNKLFDLQLKKRFKQRYGRPIAQQAEFEGILDRS